jgi:[ribosomal protein S5]-alanine N-acetyltransferase
MLKTPHCTVREYRDSDLPSLRRHADDIEVWRTLRDRFPHPYTEAAAQQWLDFVATARPVTNFAIAVNDECIGGIGYTRRTDVDRLAAEIGYWVGRAYWGRGIATAALRVFVPHVFATTDLERVDALVFATNPASNRVLEKAGFLREGTLRRAIVKEGIVHDAALWATVRADLGLR